MSNSLAKKPSQNINHLPDDILQHLLSLLPTKEAVATSILSKRWRYLWTWVSVLDIRYLSSCKINGEPKLFKLPNSYFAINSLKILKLSLAILIDIAPDESVCFPSLKILHLNFVRYANDESVSRLLLGCTALEELLVRRKSPPGDNVRKFIVNVPTLKTLKISYLTTKQIIGRDNELIINAPVLEFLAIRDPGEEPVSVHLETSIFIRLTKANFFYEGRPDLSKLCKAILKTKSLCIKCGDYMAPVMDHSFPCFHNLTYLFLNIYSRGWDVIPQFLENSPNLRTLRLKKVTLHKQYPSTATDKFVLKRLPQFLRNIHCESFEGHANELEMVKFLLKNVRSLELLQIFSPSDMSVESKLCFLDKLVELLSLNAKCQVVFH